MPHLNHWAGEEEWVVTGEGLGFQMLMDEFQLLCMSL